MIALVKIIRRDKKNRIEVTFCKDKNKTSYIKQAKEQSWQALDFNASVFLFITDFQTGLLIVNIISTHENLEVYNVKDIRDGYLISEGDFEVYITLRSILLY